MSWNKQIEAEPEQVFLLFTDIEKFPENLSGIERVELLTAGPVGVGTRFKETRIMFKRETTEEMEVTRFDPPRALIGTLCVASSVGCTSFPTRALRTHILITHRRLRYRLICARLACCSLAL